MYMFELFLLIAIVIVVIWAIRGKPASLVAPVVISMPGLYHITIAPQLQEARAFIEAIASRVGVIAVGTQDSVSCYFEVQDARACKTEMGRYLLAASIRADMLYLQAILSQPLMYDNDSHLNRISHYTEQVLERLPCNGAGNIEAELRLVAAVQEVACTYEVQVVRLSA